MTTKTLRIDGMSCGHCIKAVTMGLLDLPGVSVREVKVGEAVVDVDDSVVTDAQLAAAIEEAGFALVTPLESERV